MTKKSNVNVKFHTIFWEERKNMFTTELELSFQG